ncbi:hypothetical protein AGMMS49593_04940 [Endomicrobiia bacterium]|nr:hypothetical protein AGMMS49593_04940 [Endomicrobiia bacterium]
MGLSYENFVKKNSYFFRDFYNLPDRNYNFYYKKKSSVKFPEEKKPEIEKVIIQGGDVFTLTLNKTKLSRKDANNIAKELNKVVDISYCIPGDFYEILYDNQTGEWTNFSYYPSGISYYCVTKSSDNKVIAKKNTRNNYN